MTRPIDQQKFCGKCGAELVHKKTPMKWYLGWPQYHPTTGERTMLTQVSCPKRGNIFAGFGHANMYFNKDGFRVYVNDE